MSKKSKGRAFAKSQSQAKRAAQEMWKSGEIAGLGTSRTYQDGLKQLSDWMSKNGGGSLQELSIKRARKFLAERAQSVGQKTLDRDRQAVQALLQHTGKLRADQHLKVIEAGRQQELKSRSYTPAQVHVILQRMEPHNALAAEIAHAAGLRAHELITLARLSETSPDVRPADPAKFACREAHTKYVVTGKGGLIREVSIPDHLVTQLESRRLAEPRIRRDRQIIYQQRYDIGGGQALSQAFSRASKEALGFSHGAHGVRHDYAQQRHYELQVLVGDPVRAKRILSQELGHFRPEITDVYLR